MTDDRVNYRAFYLAICLGGCLPPLPMPFYEESKRDEWAEAHEDALGHAVWKRIEWKKEAK